MNKSTQTQRTPLPRWRVEEGLYGCTVAARDEDDAQSVASRKHPGHFTGGDIKITQLEGMEQP
jgi:hypothetical protein